MNLEVGSAKQDGVSVSENELELADSELAPQSYSREDIESRVLDMIRAAPPAKKFSVELDSSLEDIKMDSLEKLSIAMDLEDFFNIHIDDETVEGFSVVHDLSDYLIGLGLAGSRGQTP